MVPRTAAQPATDTPRGFTQVPNTILRDPRLSDSAKLAWAMIKSYAWESPDSECWASQDRIRADLGWSLSKLKRAMIELKRAGLIEVERRRTNHYHPIEPNQVTRDLSRERTTGHQRPMEQVTSEPWNRSPVTSKEDSVKNTKVSRPKPPPTDKQRTKLAELAEECDIECPPVATRAEASEAIRELLAQKDANRHAAEAGEAWRYAPVAHQSSGRCLIHDLSWIGDCPECQREREQPERALADLTDEELLELFPGSTIQHVEKLEKAA